MTLHLSTFGALELRSAPDGDIVAGAAAQPKPLLILALAALTPGGIPRPRLLGALWPGTDRTRARATLKQHLYALRRATNAPQLVGGAPRLRIDARALSVDALQFAALVDQGRLEEAATLLRGELLEGIAEAPGATPELQHLVHDLRDQFRSRVALVRQAIATRRATPTEACRAAPARRPLARAEHDLAGACQRFVRQLVALPDDAVAAYHRAAAASHDLIEGLRGAELAGCPARDIADLTTDARDLWLRSDLVRKIRATSADRDDPEVIDWLLQGAVRTTDPIGQTLEWHLVDSPLALHLRARARWRSRCLIQAGTRQGARILMVGCAESAALAAAVPVLDRSLAHVVLAEADQAALDLAMVRFQPLGDRVQAVPGDPFRQVADLFARGPYDLVSVGTFFDRLPPRAGGWLVSQLVEMLAPGGELTLTSFRRDHPFGPWLRHVAGWNLTERDQDDILFLLSDNAERFEVEWGQTVERAVWKIVVRETPVGAKPRDQAA